MNWSEFGLIVMCVLVLGFAGATLFSEFQPAIREFFHRQQSLRQSGDSSLSPNSVNWLAAAAFAGALLICFG